MLSKVQAAEKTLKDDFKKINDTVLTQKLGELDETAKASLSIMQRHLSVAEERLSVAEKHLDIAQESLELHKYNLPIEDSALYNSRKNQHIPLCQEGTREGIRNRITLWANDVESETIWASWARLE